MGRTPCQTNATVDWPPTWIASQAGFRPSTTGAELRVLARLFTPQEAELATHLTLAREDAQAIAARAHLPLAEVTLRLAEMARKGLIFAIQPADGPAAYQAAPWVIGIYEFQVNNLSAELLQDLNEYGRTRQARPRPPTTPQMRTIQVEQSIEPHLAALPYEQVHALVAAHDRFAVAPCICRRRARLTGGGCNAPEESCLVFGEWADYYVQGGRGRPIDRAEVLAILARADAANLVLQPTNSQEVAAICCCGGVLKSLQSHPKPAEVVASAFIAQLTLEICEGCWTCLDRCQMQALSAGDARVLLNQDRCIGCGLCVSTCPSGALTLVRKPARAAAPLPATMAATWRTISRELTGAQ